MQKDFSTEVHVLNERNQVMAAASTREIIEYEVGKAADEIYRHIDIPNYVDHSVPEA